VRLEGVLGSEPRTSRVRASEPTSRVRAVSQRASERKRASIRRRGSLSDLGGPDSEGAGGFVRIRSVSSYKAEARSQVSRQTYRQTDHKQTQARPGF
jgi:hypothetical protein